VGEQAIPGLGQAHRPALTGEEPVADDPLQLRDPRRQGRLGQVKAARRCREAAGFHYRKELAEVRAF